jgi:hypothetical protein
MSEMRKQILRTTAEPIAFAPRPQLSRRGLGPGRVNLSWCCCVLQLNPK